MIAKASILQVSNDSIAIDRSTDDQQNPSVEAHMSELHASLRSYIHRETDLKATYSRAMPDQIAGIAWWYKSMRCRMS